jgi:pimeloyl-ACP methyl ester carboxylesterase
MDYWKAYQLPEFQKSHEVVLLDTRGHGRSELGNEAFRYSTLSRDVLALMDHLGFQKAHFVGWSDGGVVALQLALQEPQRVGRIVLNGASFAFQGSFAPWVEYVVSTEWLFRLSMLKYYDAFAATQPDPTRWRTFVGRMHALWSSPCYLDEYLGEYLGDYLGERQREREHEGARHGNERSPADCIPLLGRISQEVLILNGDQEVITPSHTLALFGALPRARLTLLEGATHFAARERPDAFNDAVLSFLRP